MAATKKTPGEETALVLADTGTTAVERVVAQHNALVNARFSFVPLQMRLFLALLSRIKFDDVDFKEHFIPVNELVFERHGGSAYQQIDEMCGDITSFKLYIELLEEDTRKRRRRPKFDYIPLMAKAGYDGERGGVVATFNPLIMPYLLQLRESGNFTLAALNELRKLKSPNSVRIYWLLKEHADFGQRTISLEQLRFMLDIAETEYPRFSNFKARVLDRAQVELARTDLPFTFELERQNQIVQRIKFLFGVEEQQVGNGKNSENSQHVKNAECDERGMRIRSSATAATSTRKAIEAEPQWMQALRLVGVSQRSLRQISQQLEAGDYPLAYVEFVLNRIGKQHQLGKVKRPAGAIYKALVEKYLLEEFTAAQAEAVRKPPPARVAAPVIGEVAFPLREVREMFLNPGPFLKRQLKDHSFEQHLEATYLQQGFVLTQRQGEDWLVKTATT